MLEHGFNLFDHQDLLEQVSDREGTDLKDLNTMENKKLWPEISRFNESDLLLCNSCDNIVEPYR